VKGSRRLISLLIASAVACAACGSSGPASATPAGTGSGGGGSVDCQKGSIAIAGSTALQPLIQDAANAYMNHCPDAAIIVNGGGSGTGLSQVVQGAVDIGSSDVLASAKLIPADAGKLVDHVICRQGWIVVVNKDVTGIANLTVDQERQIWTAAVKNWSSVGGPDLPIILIIRPASSGTRTIFEQTIGVGVADNSGQLLTEDSNGAVVTAVAKTSGAISVIGFAYYNVPANRAQLTGIQFDGVDATIGNVGNGSYKLAADGHLYTKGEATGLTAAFLAFMKSDEVQKTIIPNDAYGPLKG